MYGDVELGFGGILVYMFFGEGKMPTYIYLGLRFGEVGSVAANVGYHSTSDIPDLRVRM